MEMDAPSFIERLLPLYQGPTVKITIRPAEKEYTVLKNLICEVSPVFKAMFNGQFGEAHQLTLDLEEMEDVLSVRSLEAFLQWLHLRSIKFDIKDPTENISAAIELARLGDKYDIREMETTISEYIKEILVTNPNVKEVLSKRYSHLITRDHIISATVLSRENPVRQLMVVACAREYVLSREYRFAELLEEYPSIGVDILREVGIFLNKMEYQANRPSFDDPIDGEKWIFNRF
ncbi:hypothetical protein N7456_007997 [Penicillium angulare]|uniref:BTB domain-containing protein n=1 Tax=Penicillium angulare TaxID=116970 RepID=A0A9W9K995_9EURO|nr:hypothetical protein N7456_007997 [Penicillium angulare]